MGIVYIIECNITGEVYIGSTMRSLEDRYKQHWKRNNRCSSRSIIERGNHMVRALEVVDTEDKTQLEIREQYWMNQYECVNQRMAYLNDEQRKQRLKERSKKSCDKHREKRRERERAWRIPRDRWRASWNVDGRKMDATNLLDIDPTLFD